MDYTTAPPPWRLHHQFVVDAKGGIVCDLSPTGPDGSEAARGTLIALAPELLTALQDAATALAFQLHNTADWPMGQRAYAAARSLIDRADRFPG